MDYKSKYIKYKNKYLQLQSQIGNGRLACFPSIESSIPGKIYEETIFNMTTDDRSPRDPLYDRFIRILSDISGSPIENKIFILVLGASPIVDASTTVPHKFVPDIGSLFKEIQRAETGDNIFLIAIDPSTPQYNSIKEKIDALRVPESNINKIRGYFPLAPGNDKGNIILNKLINLNVNKFIILNEMGSGCYSSIKAIKNNRAISYYANVNIPSAAHSCGEPIYGHKGTYNRCKRENPTEFTKDWINLKTMTDEGDATEPITPDEYIDSRADKFTLEVRINELTGSKTINITVHPEISVSELLNLITPHLGEYSRLLLNGKSMPDRSEENFFSGDRLPLLQSKKIMIMATRRF